MNASKDSAPSASRLQTLSFFGIALVCLVCVALIGGVGYAKYRLDRSEALLAAPDSALDASQDIYQRAILSLGYGGFLGSAQTFVQHHDTAVLADMKHNLNTADEAIHRLSDKAPAAVRHDLAGILALFQTVELKAEQGRDGSAEALTANDLLPLAAALPMLDLRLQSALAQNKVVAQADLKVWSNALTLAAWGGLVLAISLAVGFFIALRGRQAIPMKALAQSISNMTQGDMQTPVWGLERDDSIGDLARAVDLARYRFSQMPDVTLMSEQGPVRLKFEGEAKSLFEALTQSIYDDHQKTFAQTSTFMDSIGKHKDLLITLVGRLNAALNEIQSSGLSSQSSLREITRTVTESAQAHMQTQERVIGQISKLIPYMQERARNMADVTALTGEQVTQTLQRLSNVEGSLTQTSTRSQQLIQQLAESANQMSERLFGALNIMQASSRVLTETTESAQTRFNEVVDTLSHSDVTLQKVLGRAEERLKNTVNAEENMAALASRTEDSAGRIESAVGDIVDKNRQLSDEVLVASQRMDSILASFDGAQRSMGDAVQQIRRDGTVLGTLLQDLRANNDQLLSSAHQNSQTNFATIQNLTERAQALLQRLEVQIAQQAQSVEGRIDAIASHGNAMSQQVQMTTEALAEIIVALRAEQDKFMTTSATFTESLDNLGERMENHALTTFDKTERLATDNYAKLSTLADQMDSVMQRLGILGQLTGTLGTVAGQLGQLVPALTHSAGLTDRSQDTAQPQQTVVSDERTIDLLNSLRDELKRSWADVMIKINKTAPSDIDTQSLAEDLMIIFKQPWEELVARLGTLVVPDSSALTETLRDEMREQWHRAVVQIEAMNDQLAQMVVQQKDQIETRLIIMDKKLKAMPADDRADTDDGMASVAQQTAIMNEIVAALANLNDHVEDLDNAVETLQDEREKRDVQEG